MDPRDPGMHAKNERDAPVGFSNAVQGVIGKTDAHVVLVVKF